MRKRNTENHTVKFPMDLFVNYGGKGLFGQKQKGNSVICSISFVANDIDQHFL